MADNITRIILTALDSASPALASVTRGLLGIQTQALQTKSALQALGVTAAAGTMVAFVRSTINAADEMQKLSQRTGVAAKDLAGWQLAANLSGASMESVAKGIKGLATYAAEYGDTLRQVGIDTQDPQRALIQLADLFSAMPDGMQKTALATKLFGKAGLDLLPMLNQGSAALEAQRAKAEEYGRKMAEIGPDAERFNDQLEETAFYAKAAGMNIAAHFLPGLEGMSKWLVDVARGGEHAMKALDWIMGERFTRLMVLAGHPLLVGPDKRSSSGRIGGAGQAAIDEEALGEKNAAALRAAQLLDATSGGKKAAAAKARRAFDPEGDFDIKFAEMQRKYLREGQDAAEREAEALKKKRIAMEDMAEKRMEANRIESEGEEAIREHLEKTTAAMAKQKTMAQDLGLTFASAAEDAILKWESVGDVLRGLGQDVARIFLRSTITEPLGNSLAGAFKGMGGGSGLLSGIKNMFTFDGGGYTGAGSRSGGLDGKGGFMAVLHPNETVVDHNKGGAVGGGVTIIQHISIDSRSDQGTIAAAMVQAKNAAVAEVHNAMRRGAWA